MLTMTTPELEVAGRAIVSTTLTLAVAEDADPGVLDLDASAVMVDVTVGPEERQATLDLAELVPGDAPNETSDRRQVEYAPGDTIQTLARGQLPEPLPGADPSRLPEGGQDYGGASIVATLAAGGELIERVADLDLDTGAERAFRWIPAT